MSTIHEVKRAEVGASLAARNLVRRQHLVITQERQAMPSAIVTPRPVSPRPRSKVRTHVGYQPSLADKIRAAARPPRNEAERQALDRAIAFAHLLDEALRACLARIKEHLVWREQMEQARAAAKDLEYRIESSRNRMVAARMKVDALMLRHPIKVRLAKAGMAEDPTETARERFALHHRHVLEDSKTLKELRGKVAIARGKVRRSEKVLEQRKESVRCAAWNLAEESLPAYQHALNFLPSDAAELVREVMDRNASSPTRPMVNNDGSTGSAGQAESDGRGGRGTRVNRAIRPAPIPPPTEGASPRFPRL